MEKAKSGDFSVDLNTEGKDEIGQLSSNFRSLIEKISAMIDEKYELGQAVKTAEFNALQHQINPHFLYNSLDLINCLAIQDGAQDIVQIVNALVSYYRLSLSHGDDIVPIAQELRHAATYIKIQNMRFDKKTELIYEDKLWYNEYLIPKITFQPLVENAVLHGILESDAPEGSIYIDSVLTDSVISISIRDNGCGMDESVVNKLNNHQERNGFGVGNINERLKLYFGNEYGLIYTSEKGYGTTVTITIPAVKEDLLP